MCCTLLEEKAKNQFKKNLTLQVLDFVMTLQKENIVLCLTLLALITRLRWFSCKRHEKLNRKQNYTLSLLILGCHFNIPPEENLKTGLGIVIVWVLGTVVSIPLLTTATPGFFRFCCNFSPVWTASGLPIEPPKGPPTKPLEPLCRTRGPPDNPTVG